MTQTSFLGDKSINRIGFGAMQLADPGVFGSPKDPEGCRAVLRRALELGVDHIDTSQYYGPHEVAFVPFFPLGSAFTGAPAKLALDPVISAVAAKHGVLPTQVALAWLLAHYERMLLIPQQVGRPLG